MELISLPTFICDLFPLIKFMTMTRDVGIHSFFNIMADRRYLRQRIIARIENVFLASEAGRRCHVPLRTAQRWAHKFQNYGECQRRYSTGRPSCSTREEDKAVR